MNWKERYAKEDEDPCWCGYHMVGMKDKDGKKVPNCVPNEKKKKKSNVDWTERYAHEGVPTGDLEALVGHLIGPHKYPAKGMKNLLKDFSGEFGDQKIPLSEVCTELNTFHRYEHKEQQ